MSEDKKNIKIEDAEAEAEAKAADEAEEQAEEAKAEEPEEAAAEEKAEDAEAKEEGKEEPEKAEDAAKKAEEEAAQESERYMRLMAEFQNYKRRAAKEKTDTLQYANEKIVADILPVLDNFERALTCSSYSSSSTRPLRTLVWKR